MKKVLVLILLVLIVQTTKGYDKKTLIERFTNVSCPPCASVNNNWYNQLMSNFIDDSLVSHIVYNVSWPSNNDPMYVLNKNDNSGRTEYYGINGVPSIIANGVNTNTKEEVVRNAVTNGNAEFSPFMLELSSAYYTSNVLKVNAKITRDATDTSSLGNLVLRLAITEKTVEYSSAPGSNGEKEFYSVSRKMLPDHQGTSFEAPDVGESIEFNYEFTPGEDFLKDVNMKNLRLVAFIQNNSTKEVFQSEMEDIIYLEQLEAVFSIEEHIGIPPFTVKFKDHSTSSDSTQILSWEWDFNNDGVIDSEEQEPTWVFENEGTYTVSLTVKDEIETFTTVEDNFVSVIGNTANILVVNGINYNDFSTEMTDFYSNSTCFAGNEVDVWDLYGDQMFNYVANPSIKRTHLFGQYIPSDVLNLYEKVIWIDHSHLGGTEIEVGDQIIDYVNQGGNFLLASSKAGDFFNNNLLKYCGVSRFSPARGVTGIVSVDQNLLDQNVTSTNTTVQFARLSNSSAAIPIFTKKGNNDWLAGFTYYKGAGGFIYVGGSPYLYKNNEVKQNFDYIIKNLLRNDPIIVGPKTFFATVEHTELSDTLGSEIIFEFEVENISDSTITLYFKRESNVLPEEWTSSLCFTFCFRNDLDSVVTNDNFGSSPIVAGETRQFSLHVNPLINEGTGNIEVVIGNLNDPTDMQSFNLSASSIIDAVNSNDLNDKYTLRQNYPNPFNPSTTITFSVEEAGFGSLKVYDVLGNLVKIIFNKRLASGEYSVNFDATNLSSGVYFYKLNINNFVQTKKMILGK